MEAWRGQPTNSSNNVRQRWSTVVRCGRGGRGRNWALEITRGRQLGRLKSDGFGGRIEQLGGRGVQPVTHLHGAWGKWQGRWDGETREGKERKKERKKEKLFCYNHDTWCSPNPVLCRAAKETKNRRRTEEEEVENFFCCNCCCKTPLDFHLC